jgi:hypothetical protein
MNADRHFFLKVKQKHSSAFKRLSPRSDDFAYILPVTCVYPKSDFMRLVQMLMSEILKIPKNLGYIHM